METRSKSSQTGRKTRKEQSREDVIHTLEEAWYLDPKDTFQKIFHKHSRMSIEPTLLIPKEELV